LKKGVLDIIPSDILFLMKTFIFVPSFKFSLNHPKAMGFFKTAENTADEITPSGSVLAPDLVQVSYQI